MDRRTPEANPMPRFAANVSTLFTELPLLERIDAAADAGFTAIEFQAPYEAPADAIASRVEAGGLKVVLLNAPNGTRPGDQGLGGVPGREADYWANFETAMSYARALGAANLRIISGRAAAGADREAMLQTLAENLRRAAPVAAAAGVTLLLEPLNATDVPGYLLPNIATALGVIDQVGHPNVSLQLDFYHLQMTGGDLAGHAARLIGRYAHVQISNAPGRREPGVGEIDYRFLFDHLDRIGYGGWIGCEYFPATDTGSSLAWAAPWGIHAHSRGPA
ncbi:MAG: TIM barrel protein [Caulobacteraceae bacterium]